MGPELRRVVDGPILELCATLATSVLARRFYLAGETGLAVQLRHRRSEDLDFFTIRPVPRLAGGAVAKDLIRLFGHEAEPVQRQIDQATWRVRGVHVTFVAYPFGLRYPLVPGASVDAALRRIALASPKEIALMKAYAVGRGATFRDYVDLYVLLKGNAITLKELVQEASGKFVLEGRPLFSQRLFLEQLVYLKDLEDVHAALALTIDPVTPEEVEQFFRDQVEAYVRSELHGAEEPR